MSDIDLIQVILRLFLAALCGAVIGSDRVIKGRPAGIKTHSLVALGASLAMLSGEYIMLEYGDSQDVSRLAAQVISGIGFLGAGTIMFTQRHQVYGLTTAAGLWFAGILGISLGGGWYDIALISMLVWAFIFFVLGRLDMYLSDRNREYKLYLTLSDDVTIMSALVVLDELNIRVTEKASLNESETNWLVQGTLMTTQGNIDFEKALNDVHGIEVVKLFYV